MNSKQFPSITREWWNRFCCYSNWPFRRWIIGLSMTGPIREKHHYKAPESKIDLALLYNTIQSKLVFLWHKSQDLQPFLCEILVAKTYYLVFHGCLLHLSRVGIAMSLLPSLCREGIACKTCAWLHQAKFLRYPSSSPSHIAWRSTLNHES